MSKVLVYKENDTLIVVHPTGEVPIEQVAKNDIPAGLPYKIMDVSGIPTDRTFRDAWDMDESLFVDGVGGQ